MNIYEDYENLLTLAALPEKIIRQMSLNPEEVISQGIDALMHKKWNLASELFRVVLKADSNNSEALLGNLLAVNEIDDWAKYSKQLIKTAKIVSTMPDPNINETYILGAYQGEPIEWIVLDKKDGKALLISKYGLDSKAYYRMYGLTTWEKSDLRKWLNDSFIKAAFHEEERNKIALTHVTADPNPRYDTDPGRDTEDKIFLLSIQEAEKYFDDNEARKCIPTKHALKKGAQVKSDYKKDGKECSMWWLRSPGRSYDYAAGVFFGGSVYCYGSCVRGGHNCVRPALWIDLG